MKPTIDRLLRWLKNEPAPRIGLVSLTPETRPSAPYKECRCCGKPGLSWAKYEGKWRLFEQESIHICPVNPLVLESGLELSTAGDQ